MSPQLLIVVLFGSLLVLITFGLPFAFAMGGLGALFTLLLWGPNQLYNAVLMAWGSSTTFMLLPIPLFILMGNLLRYSGIIEDLFEMAHRWMGRVPGGIAVITITIGTALGAMCGASAGSTTLLGLTALPPMLKRGYNKRLAVATIAAAGSLALLIPPSIDPVIYGFYAEASVGKLLIAGIGPGLVFAALCSLYLILRCYFQPHLAPRPSAGEGYTWKEKMASFRAILMPIILVILVTGTIYLGITTPTEGAAMGAIGTFFLVALQRRLSWSVVRDSAISTAKLSVFILWVIMGGSLFATVLSYGGGSKLIREGIVALQLGLDGTIVLQLFIVFIMGMFMDPTSIVIITVPVFIPIIKDFGVDQIWYGTIYLIALLTSFLTPPVGYNLFYVKAIAPPDIHMGDIYIGIQPFVFLLLITIALVYLFPQIALYIPSHMRT